MAYAQVLERIGSQLLLHSVLFELTLQCNLACFICYNNRERHSTPLGLGEYRQILADLAALGTMNLTLSGGEPMLHRHFFAIGRAARELGFVVRIKTNGSLLTPERARRVQEEIAPFYLELSLHGACAATHDRQTRVAGSFDTLMANIHAMQQIGLSLRFSTPITIWNQHEFAAMRSLSDDLGIPMRFDLQLSPRDNGDREPLSIAVGRELLDEQLVALGAGHADIPSVPADRCCGVGFSSLVVDPYGEVFPCVQLRTAVGNLHHQSIAHIWPDAPMLRHVRAWNRDLAKRPRHPGFCPALDDSGGLGVQVPWPHS